MSSKALEWARTHEFDNSAVVRTAILRFLAEQADDDGYVADHTGDKGIAFIMHETCASKSTVIRVLKEFEEAGLIHREKRPYKNFGGKMTDLIVLNLAQTGTKTPWRTLKVLRQIHQAGRVAFGAPIAELEQPSQPVDNSESPIGVTLTPNPKTPSQTEGVTLTPNPTVGVTLAQARCHSDILDESALKGTRARTIPMTIPVSQSVQNSEPVENSTDRPTEDEPKNSSPADAPAPQALVSKPARITRGVNHTKLRRELHQAQLNTNGISDEVLAQMIIIVLSRATQAVRSPQRFVYSCIVNEFHELVSLAQSTLEHPNPAQVPARRLTCPIHQTDYSAGCECSGCRADRLAAPAL